MTLLFICPEMLTDRVSVWGSNNPYLKTESITDILRSKLFVIQLKQNSLGLSFFAKCTMTSVMHLGLEDLPFLFWKKTGLITHHSQKAWGLNTLISHFQYSSRSHVADMQHVKNPYYTMEVAL
jgi:hypothetical protein